MNGKKNWVFCDGDLPPHGYNPDFLGHEALMITNVGKKDAKIRIKIFKQNIGYILTPQKSVYLKCGKKA